MEQTHKTNKLVKKRSDYKTIFLMDNLTKNPLDGPFVDELGASTGPWPRYLVMTSTDEGKPSVNFHLLQFTRVFRVLLGVKSLLNVSLVVIFI